VGTAVVVVLTTVVETEADTNLTYFQKIYQTISMRWFFLCLLITKIDKQLHKMYFCNCAKSLNNFNE
ncbi:hypothetical protein, partial [Flavobacterium psychrophilum]|uniref:hypothetical protein n=1 Tax=Flavobacterium psychrophilum TaxID=96345 RepID=UPI001C52D316